MAATRWLITCLLLNITISLTCGQETIHYVTPSETEPCPADPCFTLSHYTASPDQYFVSGATFVFLPGEHHLRVDGFVVIHSVTNLSLVGSRNASVYQNGEHLYNLEPLAIVSCPYEFSGFAFMNVSNLHIRDLGFDQCGAVIPPDLATEAVDVQTTSPFVIPENSLKAALFLVNVHSLDMEAVLVERSFGYGLLAINVVGEVLVHQCFFWGNNLHTYFTPHCHTPGSNYDCVGGNARFVYSDPPECPKSAQTYTVRIHESTFAVGVDIQDYYMGQDSISWGTGLGVSFTQRVYGVRLVLSGIVAYGNTGGQGANLYFKAYSEVEGTSVILDNCLVSHGNVLYPELDTYYMEMGAGMAFHHGVLAARAHDVEWLVCEDLDYKGDPTQEILAVYDSSFVDNGGVQYSVGGGILLQVLPHSNPKLKRVITIDGVNVSNNLGLTGSGMWLSEQLTVPLLDVTIANSEFSHNRVSDRFIDILEQLGISGGQQARQVGALIFERTKNVTIANSIFLGNELSAISASNSQFHLRDNVTFLNNSGSDGGAISLLGESILFLYPHTHVNFIGNHALRTGGAIYVSGDYVIDSACFFQVVDPTFLPTSQVDIRFVFENNTAVDAGDALYGGSLERCAVSTPSGFMYHDLLSVGGEIFDAIAEINQEDSGSVISSSPEGICFCIDEKPECPEAEQNFTIFRYPGQSFEVSLVTVGQRQGTVPAVVASYFFPPTAAQFGPLQDLQATDRHCVNLTYTVSSNRKTEIVLFSPENSFIGEISHLSYVTLRFLPCPVGFEHAEELGICSCSKPLKDRNITCDIEHETISRVSPYWFSAKSGELAIHDHCPFDYCIDETVEMDLAEPDGQCDFDRSGVLCGGCRDGLSLTLGTSNCRECSNMYLLLIIPFAIAGILLVVVLSALNLTVKVGTIHGLIFYANVVKINQAAFFPPGEVSFFTMFVSWLNLDFGIESCFFDGMDAYSKTWLQFAFPLYIWGIGVAIIVCARYSTRVSETFSNAVHVLDTLFLLSYTKILRTVITALQFTILEYQGSKSDETVWLYDGNLIYGEVKHIPLIIFACLCLLLAFPYTFILLFAQLLRRYSDKRAFDWVAKFKPYLDAYSGPYKNSHGYWTGLLLLARVVFVLVFAFNVLGDPAVNVMVVNIVSFLLAVLVLGTGGVYKSLILNLLEASLLVNLGVLAAATCYISEAGGNQQALVYTSVAIAFVEFLGIVAYHFLLRLKERCGFSWPQIPDLRKWVHRFQDPPRPARHATEQLAVGLDELVRPGVEGLFDDDIRGDSRRALKTTYVDVRALEHGVN